MRGAALETEDRKLRGKLFVMRVLAAGAVALAASCWLPGAWSSSPQHTTAVASPAPLAGNAALPDFSAIVSAYGPAVVNISTSGTQETGIERREFPRLDPDDPFYEFFRRFGIPFPEFRIPRRGVGSGFIVKPDGLVLTNAHVVADADEVTVKLTDRREYKAKVLGVDKLSDIAVLKIEAEDLPVVKLGDASRIRVGEWVLAIGSPFGFENSATAGIVSAKARTLPNEGYVPFIQTDVAVNPGNSGGPLFNLNGEVVGVNSQIYSRTGGYQGISFAIPIDVAMKVQSELLEHGKVERGRLGITIQEVNQTLAESFGLKRPTGALVSSVEKGSPAEKAGIKPGDVILEFNGSEIVHWSQLPARVVEIRPGSEAKLTIWRAGNSLDVTVAVGALSSEGIAGAMGADIDKHRLGLAVRALTPDESRQADVEGGLRVEDSRGPAARAGIRRGDIVLALNGEPVSSVEELRALVARAGTHVALLVQRGGTRIYVPIHLG